ncbi:hypothetical protein HanIR_Chr09g0411931 [Helianthus annuus]|nr:hypothetical protein HanIR_Chr09g0411931 [Helianthus annuus]
MRLHSLTGSSLSCTRFRWMQRQVADGDTVTVYVSTSDARETSRVPQEVQMAAVERIEALTERNYTKADLLQKRITDVELLGFLQG